MDYNAQSRLKCNSVEGIKERYCPTYGNECTNGVT